MSIQRIPAQGPAPRGKKVRYKVRIKHKGVQVACRTFDSEAEAKGWEAEEAPKYAGGFNRALSKKSVGAYADTYLVDRAKRVQPGTLTADRAMVKQLPQWFRALELRAVTPAHVEKWQRDLVLRGVKAATIVRYRQSLSPMFERALRDRGLTVNPVRAAETVGSLAPNRERINPYSTHEELLADVGRIAERNYIAASVYLLLALTGLRWSEARCLTVADFQRHGLVPRLIVSKAQPEGQPLKVTKSGRDRVVPIEPAALPILERFAAGKRPGDLLLTSATGSQLHRSPFVRSAGLVVEVDEARHVRAVAGGRRIHDLRHTAAVRWLTAGVPLHTVKEWLGHSSISTTERYLQHVGGAADRAALNLLASTWVTDR